MRVNPGSLRWICLLTGLFAIGGCAHFEYNVRFDTQAQHIGSKTPLVVSLPPIEYHMLAVNNRLVLHIFNHSPQSLRLRGDRSVVVDARGQSHPLHELVISSGSFGVLVFPPPIPADFYPGGGFGFGWDFGFGGWRRGLEFGYVSGFYQPWNYGPPRVAVYDNPAYYWHWNDDTSIRATLIWQQGDQLLPPQTFSFRQQRM